MLAKIIQYTGDFKHSTCSCSFFLISKINTSWQDFHES